MSNKSTDPFAAVTVVDQVRESEEDKIVNLRDEDGKIDLFGKDAIEPIDSVVEIEEDDEPEVVVDVFAGRDKEEPEEEDEPEEDEPEEDDEGRPPTDSSEEGEEDEEGEEYEEGQEDDEVNLHYFIAEELKKDGFLSDDFELTDDVSLNDVYGNLKDNLQESVTAELQTQAYNQLIELGYNEQDLQFAKLIRSGADLSMLSDVNRYEKFSSVKVDEASDADLESLVKNYYKDRKWKDAEIEERIEDLKLDEKLASVADEAKNHFKSKYTRTLEDHEAQAETRRIEQEQLQRQRLQQVESLLSKGEILGDKLADKSAFRKSLYQQTHVAEIGGKEYPVSEYQLFALQFQNDPSVALWAFNQWKNKEENNIKTKTKAKAEAEEELFKGLKKVYKKKKGKTVTKHVKPATTSKKTKGSPRGPKTETGRLINQLKGR